MSWHEIPEFKNQSVNVFHLTEISTSNVTERWTMGGFMWTGVPSHGNIVMLIEAFHNLSITAPEFVTITYGD